MADLDSRSKRASSVQYQRAYVGALPLPDGTLDQGDRQHIALAYSGILVGAPPSFNPIWAEDVDWLLTSGQP